MVDSKPIMKKYSYLIKTLKEKKKIAIAFSGGLDSSFIAYVAKQAGIDVLLLTVTSPLLLYPIHWIKRLSKMTSRGVFTVKMVKPKYGYRLRKNMVFLLWQMELIMMIFMI
jgi:uncharacterized radical SAM superfamily protein